MVAVADTFDRTNGGVGSNWSADTGDAVTITTTPPQGATGGWRVWTNALYFDGSVTGDSYFLRWIGTALAGADNYAEAVVDLADSSNFNGMGPVVRKAAATGDANSDGYGVVAISGAYYLLRFDNSADTVLASWGTTDNNEHTLRVEAEGSTIRMLVDGVQRASVTDATYSSGSVGVVSMRYSGADVTRVVEWEAGDLNDGTAYTQSIAGTLGLAGTAVKSTRRALAGTLATAGAIVKQARKILSGAAGFAGELVTAGQEFTADLSGALGLSGAVVRQTAKGLAGTIAPTGAIVKLVSRALAGAVGLAGVVVKAISRALAGAVASSGAAVKSTSRAIAGTIATSGAVLRQAGRVVAGTIAPAGAVSRAISRALAGAVAPSGALAQSLTYLRSLAGSLRFGDSAGSALRFYGNDLGSGTTNIDRVQIPLDDGSATAVDVGAGDFTVELWLNCLYANNTSSGIGDARESNIFFDRDIWGDASGHVMGVTRRSGPILAVCFGLAGSGGTWATIYGTTDVGDGEWHHVALVRRQSTGAVEIYVDGTLDASGTYTTGDISFAGSGGGGGSPNDSDPYIVLGAEKHDADPDVYLSYNGLMDELRISDTRRYTTTFTPPTSLFAVDADTMGLYHFDDGSGTTLTDSANGVNGALLVGGTNSGPTWGTSTAPLGSGVRLVKQTRRALAGALAPVGAIVKAISRALAGVVDFAGAISTSNNFTADLAGTLGLAGAVVKSTSRAITGTIAPSGAAVKAMSRALAGTVSLAGAVTKSVARAIAGAVTPAGDVGSQSVLLRSLEGAVGLSGALVRSTSRSLAGAIAPAGAVVKSVARALTGSVDFAGAVAKAISRALSGAIATAGTIAGDLIQGVIAVALTGAVGFAGAVVKQTGKVTEGAMGLSGAASKAMSRALSGAVGFAGSVATAGKFIGQKFRAMWRGLFKGMR